MNTALIVLGIIFAPLLSVLIAPWWVSRKAKKVNDLAASNESRRVDGEAYDRARDINKEVVSDLRAELDRLQAELNRERHEREEDRRNHQEEIRQLTDEVTSLRRELAALRGGA